MLKKKPKASARDPDIGTEEEHAYEGAWYRSLKAKAAHREQDAEQPDRDEPETPAGEEPAAG